MSSRKCQQALMKYDPRDRTKNPYPSHASQFREYHGNDAWIYNPWTGEKRDTRDVGTDVLGCGIRVDSEKMYSA